MAVEDTIRTVLGITGNVISFLMFLAPIPTFYKICKWKDTRGFSGVPYVMTTLNCALWVLYGLPVVKPNNILVSTINGVGLVVMLIYSFIFLIYCKDKKKRMKLIVLFLVNCIFFAGVTLLVLLLSHTHKRRTLIVGMICIVFNVFMYASPLTIMAKVVKEKSVKYMPLFLSIFFFANGVVWTCYGCIHFDINLVVPNGMGTGLGAAQLILYAAYYRTTKWGDADPPKAVEMDSGGASLPHESAYDAV